MVVAHESEHSARWATIRSIAGKIGCSATTRRKWVREAERDRGVCAGPVTSERERLKALAREADLRRAADCPVDVLRVQGARG